MTHPTYTETTDAIRADLALYFETLTDRQLDEIGRDVIVETGGTLIEPVPARHGHWGPLEVEVSMHSILGTGTTLAEALRKWARRARRVHDEIEEELAA